MKISSKARRSAAAVWSRVRTVGAAIGGCGRAAGVLVRAYVDIWLVIELAGAGLLGGGVWVQWGSAWACMLWGALLLALAGLQAVVSGVVALAAALHHPKED